MVYAYLRDNHWDKLAYVYVVDEPNSVQASAHVRRFTGNALTVPLNCERLITSGFHATVWGG
jgi:hypothetical protein